jgi:hypothetical protein
MTNRFNKHDYIENQAKLDIVDNFFDMLERSLRKVFCYYIKQNSNEDSFQCHKNSNNNFLLDSASPYSHTVRKQMVLLRISEPT